MPIITVADLESDARKGAFRAVYLLLGPETYLRRQTLLFFKSSILDAASASFNYSEYSFRTDTIQMALISAQTFPFAARFRLVVATDLENLDSNSQDEMVQYLKNPSPKTVLVLEAEELDKRTVFFRSLREKAAVIEFPKIKRADMQRWCESHIRSQGYKISPGALKKLVDLAGSDLQSLAAEAEKLILFAGEGRVIPDAAVENLVQVSVQQSIFELSRTIANRDRAAGLKLLAVLLESGESPIGILALIARHFRQLIIAKELLGAGREFAEIGAATQVPAFALEEFLRQAKGFNADQARRIYIKLSDLDRRMKSSRGDPKMLLENLICTI